MRFVHQWYILSKFFTSTPVCFFYNYIWQKPIPGQRLLTFCMQKRAINFLSSTQKEYICKKWLPFLNCPWCLKFQCSVAKYCFYRLNVFCLIRIAYVCHVSYVFFLYLYLTLLFFKNKQITKKFFSHTNNCLPPVVCRRAHVLMALFMFVCV